MDYKKNILVTGGAGFIGSHLVRRLVNNYPEYHIINFDALTYAGNLNNLKDLENADNYTFVKGDICELSDLEKVFSNFYITDIIHLAAESHVDRSISGPMAFVMTNVVGTVNLLNIAKEKWAGAKDRLFYHISTDEVYGSLGAEGLFSETTAYDPRSPYSSSKASSDHFVMAYHHTYGLPVKISNCSNNYGSHQFPEKLIPLMINNIVQEKDLPIYGKGDNIRDWLWVEDHAAAIDKIFHEGRLGETYNIGGLNEWTNIDLVHALISIVDHKLGRPEGSSKKLIKFVTDRAGHDKRYAIDASKLEKELGWTPSIQFEEGLEKTVDWYLNNREWTENIISGDYQEYYTNQYES
ncbi:dTDP-glucose 4,6-dehydratase [Lishizhenia sp.]|uniref:dTDP-glucose 4,6-dehydratase n=1 Tax=Lishizhenia sp. TaxID=2497594 RepID=UPI00299CF7A7|nr:dTDP-glucose 4,6-dehydratase [Lishizhenia sp.]MDX1445555.1 dTDP-glucose 4,6-dehydratase [Lishizhenia sp.]